MLDDNKYEKVNSENQQRLRLFYIFLAWMVVLWMAYKLEESSSSSSSSVGKTQKASSSSSSSSSASSNFEGWKVLYVVTTLSEYDSGHRNTVRGFDRLQETVIPVLTESVESMLRFGFVVDVVIICHYEMTRDHLIRDALPDSVGLQIWDSATPLGYKLEDKKNNITSIQPITRALARQHRFIIKEKFPYYDLFANFEDDMLITGDAIHNYIEVTQELYRLRTFAPDKPENIDKFHVGDVFYGVLSKWQLQRMMPGFIRVEALLDEQNYGAQEELDLVPVTDRPQLDPNPCCHLHDPRTVSKNRPSSPTSDQLFLWETNIRALGVRKMPLQSKTLEWVVFQRGPRVFYQNLTISDYWSGRNKYFEKASNIKERIRPDTKSFPHINNQGGWMATRRQIWEWHTQICPGGFLPPYESPDYNLDGLDMRNVEYWSGGMSLFTREHGCNLQRIIPLDEYRFARSLLYHTANNKQRQLTGKKQIFVKINDFFGELNTVKKNAQAEMQKRISAINEAINSVR